MLEGAPSLMRRYPRICRTYPALSRPWLVLMGARAGLLGAHLGDIGDQAPEAEQSLRQGLGTGAHLLMRALVGDKGSDHADPAGMGEEQGAGWMPVDTFGPQPTPPA